MFLRKLLYLLVINNSDGGQAGRTHYDRRGADVLPAGDLPIDTGDDAQVQYKEGNY